MQVPEFVSVGYRDELDRVGSSSCLQNVATKDGKTTIGDSSDDDDGYYDSQIEIAREDKLKRLSNNKKKCITSDKRSEQNIGVAEFKKSSEQGGVGLHSRKEMVQAEADMDSVNTTAVKLVDMTMGEVEIVEKLEDLSEVENDESDAYELSTTKKYKSLQKEDKDSEDYEIPEVIEVESEEQMMSEEEKENEFQSENVESDGTERTRPKSARKRRKSAGNRGSSTTRAAASTHVSCTRLQRIKDNVERAIREHKTFTVQGSFPTIREAMKQRGWIEKEIRHKFSTMDDGPLPASVSFIASLTQSDGKPSESLLIARLLRNVKVDFLWTTKTEPLDWQSLQRRQIVNRFPRAYFTTKVGLCAYLQHMHWFCENDISHISFPRCYNVCHPEELTAFIDDFRITACLGLLKWLVSKYEDLGESSIKSMDGKIPFTAIEFAINRCREYIGVQSHEDIDKQDLLAVWDHQWDQFLTWYYLAVHDNFLLLECRSSSIVDLYEMAKHVLFDIRQFWPQIDLDGMNNMWIVKPGAQSRGRGIQLANKLDKVMEKVTPATMKESRYVVQKYIERPLLIYDTKFDIRQWFLVTCAQPLTIWMYKESYLRFCSQPFDLKNMHESVHLCNNAVQCKYKNGKRDSLLPDENMWDCYTFQTYLRGIGHADMWDKCIYPGMRQSIICALLSSQEHMDSRRNCFELFGADFMLSEDFSPWLIEINSCPCMQPTTSVTARMCAQCLEDVIKVVVDKRVDRKASTGMFELIYKQQIPRAPPYLGMSLSVRGTKVHNPMFTSKGRSKSAGKLKKPRDSSDEGESQSSGPDAYVRMAKSVLIQEAYEEYSKKYPYASFKAGISGVNDAEKGVMNHEAEIMQEDAGMFSLMSATPVLEDSAIVTSLKNSADEELMNNGSDVNNLSFAELEVLNNKFEKNNGESCSRQNSEKLDSCDSDSENILKKKISLYKDLSFLISSNNLDANNCNFGNIRENGDETTISIFDSHNQISRNIEAQGVLKRIISSETFKNCDLTINTQQVTQNSNRITTKYEGSTNDEGLNSEGSGSASESQVKIIYNSEISEDYQAIGCSPIHPVHSRRKKKTEYSSDEKESASSGPELSIIKKKRNVRMKNFKPSSKENGASNKGVFHTSQANMTRKSRSIARGQDSFRRECEKNATNPKTKKSMGQYAWKNGPELSWKKKKTCKLQPPSESSDDQQSFGHNPSRLLYKSKNIISRESSEEREPTRLWSEYYREKKRDTQTNNSEKPGLFTNHKELNLWKENNSVVKHSNDSSEEQELVSSESEHNNHKENNFRLKCPRNSSLDREKSSGTDDVSQKNKNIGTLQISPRRETNEVISKSRDNSTERQQDVKSSTKHKQIPENIGPTIVDLIEDLRNHLKKNKILENRPKFMKSDDEEAKLNKSSENNSKAHSKGKGPIYLLQEGNQTQQLNESKCNSHYETSNIREVQNEITKNSEKSWALKKEEMNVTNFPDDVYPNAEEVMLKRKKPCSTGWRNSNDAERSMEFFNEWRQKLDRTKASCEDMLAKLKMVRDSESVLNKPKYYSIDKGINWEGETSNKPTISDIIKKLSQTQPEREFFMYNIGRRFIDNLPAHALSSSRDRLRRKQCDINMIIEENANFVAKHNPRYYSESTEQQLSLSQQVYSPRSPAPTIALRGVLPHIKQRIKQQSTSDLFCSGRKFDNFYAVGMSLKTLQNSRSQKQHLLMPLGSDHCLGVSPSIPSAMEGGVL